MPYSVSFWTRKIFFFFNGSKFLQKLIGTIISAVFPKMSYDLTFLVKIDILTDRTFCSPTVQWYILSHNDDDNMKSTSWKILVYTTDSNHDDWWCNQNALWSFTMFYQLYVCILNPLKRWFFLISSSGSNWTIFHLQLSWKMRWPYQFSQPPTHPAREAQNYLWNGEYNNN